jgi:hypothetical protein
MPKANLSVSPEALEDCHYKGVKICLYLNNNENSELFTGKSLRLGGSSDPRGQQLFW